MHFLNTLYTKNGKSTYRCYRDDALEMMNVNVHEHPVQSREYLAAMRGEILGKRQVRSARKQSLVVYLHLDPVHQVAGVLSCR